FLPTFPSFHLMSINLRTHRKILVADGRIGFTGGLNIRVGHCLKRQPARPVQDIHFRVEGPVVSQLQEVFADDWLFTTGGAMWWRVAAHGCRIWLTSPPFDHSKLMLVDGSWVLLGSANWDPRSLRLNFEYNLECYDIELAARLERLVEAKQKAAHRVTLQEV